MRVETEVKIKILDGEEKGRVYTFNTVGESEELHREIGIIDRVTLVWNHIRPFRTIRKNVDKEDTHYDEFGFFDPFSVGEDGE